MHSIALHMSAFTAKPMPTDHANSSKDADHSISRQLSNRPCARITLYGEEFAGLLQHAAAQGIPESWRVCP